jgi:hypothetical protein
VAERRPFTTLAPLIAGGDPPGLLEAVRRCRVVVGVLVLLHLGLSATPQAVDLLIVLGQDGSLSAWLGLSAGTAWLALNAWFWSGFALARPGQPCCGRVAADLLFLLAAASLLAVANALSTASASIPETMGDHPPLWWTRVTAYAAAARSSLLAGVM